jgi:hypothetical protein
MLPRLGNEFVEQRYNFFVYGENGFCVAERTDRGGEGEGESEPQSSGVRKSRSERTERAIQAGTRPSGTTPSSVHPRAS